MNIVPANMTPNYNMLIIWELNYVLIICKGTKKPTCNSLMDTHEFEGKPCNIGTKNCKQPLQ